MFRGAGIEVGQPVNITSHPFTQVEPGVVGDLIVGFVTAECFPYPGALECSKVGIVLIDHGHTSKAVGGGISQFATTLYNAAYFAGLEDVDHTEHSYYISRYPEAREATVFDGAIDLVFRNNSDHGIVIDTEWSPSAITVRLWGTKTVEVQSITGSRSLYTDPEKVTLPAGDDCMPSNGSKGFTTSDTRVITDAKTGAEISRRTRTVKYDPEPNVVCQ